MDQKQCIRVICPCFFDVFCTDYDMTRAATFIKSKGFFRKLFRYIASQVRIWNKQDFVVFQMTADFHC